MVKIIYGVQGDGRGHATRAKVIIDELKKEHEIIIVANRASYKYLSKVYEKEKNVKITNTLGIETVYRDNKVDNLRTAVKNVKKYPKTFLEFKKLLKCFGEFKPQAVITDFEPFSARLGIWFNLPTISVTNQHILTKCSYSHPKKYLKNARLARNIVRGMIPDADYYFVTTFFNQPIKHRHTYLFKPIIRKEILKLKPSIKKHVVVYQTSDTYNRMLSVLKEFPNENFVIYGMGKRRNHKNITFKETHKDSDKEFFKDFKTAKCIIANGGFSMITEALHLEKPVFSIPIKGQFEQILNAIKLEELGYGEYEDDITKEKFGHFLKNLEKYRENISKQDFVGNEELTTRIKQELKQISMYKRKKKFRIIEKLFR